MTTLRLRDVCIGYSGLPDVVRGADLDIEPGGSVAIMGPSGCGKSTLLKAVAGLITPRSGRIEVLGRAAPEKPPKGTVGYVPQRLGLVRHTSVLDNVEHGALHQVNWWQSLLHQAPPGTVDRCLDAIRAVGLEDKAHDPILRLSGGQQRRVAVARALVQRPRLLLADEFLGELDAATARTVAQAVGELRDNGTAVLMVEHRLEQAREVADRVYRLADGALELVHG